jgi:hypothetical protein
VVTATSRRDQLSRGVQQRKRPGAGSTPGLAVDRSILQEGHEAHEASCDGGVMLSRCLDGDNALSGNPPPGPVKKAGIAAVDVFEEVTTEIVNSGRNHH